MTKEYTIESLLGDPQKNVSPQGGNAFTRWIGRTVLFILGWRVSGLFPSEPKYIVTLAPHTSNWDFVIGIGILLASGLKISFLIKKSAFFWPLKYLLNAVGGVPVDRKAAHGVVGQMITHFNTNDKMVLAIAPEGTRAKVKQWKVGFIHMAHGASVPVLPVSLAYDKKIATIGEPIKLDSDVETDLNTVKAFYLGVQGKNR